MKIKTYALLSTIYGLLLLVDGTLLITIGAIPFAQETLILEYIWVPVAIIGIWIFHKNRFPKFIPFSYLLFVAGDLMYDSYYQALARAAEGPVEISFAYRAFYAFFGLFFFLMNLRVFAIARSR